MMTEKKNRGGARPNSGRHPLGRNVPLMVRITPEASELLNTVDNKSKFVDAVIKKELGKE